MSEKILKALMRLFAIIAKSDDSRIDAKYVVESYLNQILNKEQVSEYLAIYDEYLKQQEESGEGERKKRRLAVSSVKVIVICEQINEELTQKQKFIVLLNLIQFISSNGFITDQEMELISTVSSYFNIPEEEFNLCLSLAVKKDISEIEESPNFLIISKMNEGDLPSNSENKPLGGKVYLHSETLTGELLILRVNSVGIYLLRYFGHAELFLNGQAISPGKIYILSQGSSIRSPKVQPIYYSDIIGCFLKDVSDTKIVFAVKDIEYRFKNGKTGLHKFSFTENEGKLVGIMGGSGAGKSTLLNILNGNNPPSAGEVLVNGFNLHREPEKLEGIIGYIPQDDLLIEELTVYQNLFYNSKLCFDDHTDEQIHQKVMDMLHELGLAEAKDLQVGNPLSQTISGGQRKRLNIALELIRQPSILFVDEPTSGLSSRDSENIMDLLKELALKSKLVFVVIHQPSSEIFKMFDKLLILDTGGYPIYNGDPVESVIYFKTLMNQVNANVSECITCGNVNPEQIFNIIESKVLDENGNQTKLRRISPKEWNEFYLGRMQASSAPIAADEKHSIKNNFKKPNFFKQFAVFTTRDVLAKISNKQYLYINFLEAPLLALILATLTIYYKSNQQYLFSDNKNLPAYIFMAVIVALFMGLTVSAEEIIKDRKILKRESFLNLSRGSYLTSKVLILFTISAIQTLSFVLIGNYILEVRGMYSDYWLVLFTTACLANLLGLNISSAFNSAVTIYILIPILLIPQLLLSGVLVKFEELNPKMSDREVVPVSGELMASRWAFEALAVNQFINNEYEKNTYAYDKAMSTATFKKVYWYSKMNELISQCLKSDTKKKDAKLRILKHEVEQQMKETPGITFSAVDKLTADAFNEDVAAQLKAYLGHVKKHYVPQYENALKHKDEWARKFHDSEKNKAKYHELIGNYRNNKLEDLVKNEGSELEPAIEVGNKLVATGNPIYWPGPSDRFVRAHFFAPTKNVFGKQYSTYWVNVCVLWGMSLFLWIALYYDFLRKIMRFFSDLSIAQFFRRKAKGVN
ncbi:MAG: ATP-binding cassette domain-containing protein [Bacteroidia bacterium]